MKSIVKFRSDCLELIDEFYYDQYDVYLDDWKEFINSFDQDRGLRKEFYIRPTFIDDCGYYLLKYDEIIEIESGLFRIYSYFEATGDNNIDSISDSSLLVRGNEFHIMEFLVKVKKNLLKQIEDINN